jgi:hydrogenase maturation protease
MLAIIGCGNINRSDDGVGVLIVQRLQQYLIQHPNPNTCVYDCGTGGIEVMFLARGCTKLVIIDASSTGGEPGAVYKVPGEELEILPTRGYSLHDFRWDNAIATGRQIFQDRFPQEVSVYLIEAASLNFGWELSPVVQRAADFVFEEIITSL